MARRVRESRSIQRRNKPSKKPKVKIIAYCEGKNTEPHFINDFSTKFGNNLVSVRCIAAAGTPLTIVDSCVAEKKAQDKLYRKSKDPLDKNYQVWAVFDRDDHPYIPETFDKAQGNGIKVAFSNPCFELWPYLHIADQNASLHRKKMQRNLENVLEGYDKDSSKSVDLNKLLEIGSYENAKKRAIALSKRHEEEQTSIFEANPSTNVYTLFDVIIANGKPN
ncbi:RloB domain-containing protein [Vibrio parahaemolyticus]|nr:RloB domain-containing protein [Vibrio parahaemolyticus]